GRVAVGRLAREAARSADQSVSERHPVRRAVGVLELLGARQVALYGADHGALEDLRDAGAGLPRLSGLCTRVLHDVRVRAASLFIRRAPLQRGLSTNDRSMIRHALILTAGLGTRP